MYRLKCLSGFTLIETMMALLVMAIIAVVAVPTFNTLIQNYRVSAAANEMYLFLSKARGEAIKRNMNVYVSFITGDDWCVGMNIGSGCTCSTSGSCDLSVMRATSTGQATLSIAGYTGGNFYYEGVHGMASTAGNITFTNFSTTDYVQLTVGRMGAVKMCATGVGGYSAC